MLLRKNQIEELQQAVAAIQGKSVQASIGTKLVAITSSNMNDPEVSK